MDDAQSAQDAGSPRCDELVRGSAVGRYVVLEPLGAGASGVVYHAIDPELGRGIALKVLRPRGTASVRAAVRARLQREAQALAKVSDPHVVAVFDVGVEGDLVWLAMELVRGRNLRAHLGGRPAPLRDVVALLAAAGRGLVAAHRAGLVHRDFKPENVLVADDGRVCVTDFGLACPDPTTGDPEASGSAVLAATVTREGDLVGTPAYMAPEQHSGGAADPRADQFALCVTLLEAITGERPFTGNDVDALARAKRDAARTEAAIERAGRMPPRLRAALRRGLDPDPAQRFRSMQQLVDELDRVLARAGRMRAAAALAAAGAVAVLVGGLAGGHAPSPCDGAGEHDERWSSSRRDSIAAVIDSGAPGSTESLGRLDELVARWSAASERVCEATWVAGEQSPILHEHRTACLQRRWSELDVVATMLETGDRITAAHADEIVAGMGDPSACLGAMPTRTGEPRDGAARERTLALARTIDEAAARGRAGQWSVTATRLAAAEAEVRAADDPVLLAELLRLRARAGGRDPAELRAAVDEALAVSRAAADARGEAEAWLIRAEQLAEVGDAGEMELSARMAASALALAGGDVRLQAQIDGLRRR